MNSQSEFQQQSTKASQNAFDFSQVSIARFSSSENSVLSTVDPEHTVPDLLQHTSPESQEETTLLQEQKYQDGSYVCLDQVSPVYEKSDLEGNEKSVEVHHFESDETSDTMESSSCHESKSSEADISVPESNQIVCQNISPLFSPHALERETDEAVSHSVEVNPGVSRVTPDLIKGSPESNQVFLTPEMLSDLDPVPSLQSYRVEKQNLVESSPIIDSTSLQSSTHHEVTILNQEQYNTNSSPQQRSEPEVDPMIARHTDSHEQHLQLLESPEQKPETLGDHCGDQEDEYSPEEGKVCTQLDLTIEPLIDDSPNFKKDLLSQSETVDMWIQSETSPFGNSDLSPQTTETVITCQHFDFREKSSELGSASIKTPLSQEAVVSKGLRRLQSESIISSGTQQLEEKHIDRCLSESSEPLMLTLNMNPALKKPVSLEAILAPPLFQDGRGMTLTSKDSRRLLSDSVMSGTTSQKSVSHSVEVNPGVSRVTPDLIKGSPESDQFFLTPEILSDLDPVPLLQSHRVEKHNFVESSPTIDSASLQSSTHHEVTILNQEQYNTNSSPQQRSEPEVDPMIDRHTDSHEQHLQLLESPEQKPETLGDHCGDQEDEYSPEEGKVCTQLDLTIEPLIDDSHNFKKDLLSQSETDADMWIQSETPQLSETSPFCNSDLSPQTPETVITCQHFDFREKSSELGSASIKKPLSQEAVVSKGLRRLQSESIISSATQQFEEKHIDRCLSESSEPLMLTLNMNPALKKPVSLEAILAPPLSQDGRGMTLTSKDSIRLLSDSVMSGTTSQKSVSHSVEVNPGVSRVTSDLIKGSPESDQFFLTPEILSDLDPVPLLQSHRVEKHNFVESSPTIDSASLQSSTHHKVTILSQEQYNTNSSPQQRSEPEVDPMIDRHTDSHEQHLQLLESPEQKPETLGDHCGDQENEYSPEEGKVCTQLDLTIEPLIDDSHNFKKDLLSQSENDADMWLQSETPQLSETSPFGNSDLSPQTPETVITCQHFDFREKSSELGSASIKKPLSHEAIVSKGLRRLQSESIISSATQQFEEKHIDRCLSESSEPLMLTLNMNPALKKPVSQEAILAPPLFQDGRGMTLTSKDSRRLLSDSVMSGTTSQKSEEKHSARFLSDSSEASVFSINSVLEELQKSVQPEQTLSDQPLSSEMTVSLIFGVSQDTFPGNMQSMVEKASIDSPKSQIDLSENVKLEVTDEPKPGKVEKPKHKDLLSINQHDESDPETFLDCKQTITDYSEAEEDEPWKGAMVLSNKVLGSTVHELQQQPNVRSPLGYKSSHESPRWSIRSSDSDDFEDSLIIHEPNDDAEEKDVYFPCQHKRLESSAQNPQELPPRGGVEYNDDDLRRVSILSMTSPSTHPSLSYPDPFPAE